MTDIQLLIQALQNPALYPHPVKYFQVIETHISYVILTGDYAYKIKKALDMEFLDFSTLEKRKFFCEEELRLNKPHAPEIYLDVIPVTGTPEQPALRGTGRVLEYAIQMREFPQDKLFSNLLLSTTLQAAYFVALGKSLAAIHQHAAVANHEIRFGLPAQLFYFVQQNFDQILPLLTAPAALAQLEKIENWAQQEYLRLHNIFLERKAFGFVRECHGDLHLGNIVLYQEKPLIFDSVEFNPDLRWTDTMADVGFLVMDLQEKKRADLANIFLNEYLSRTGDYHGLQVLLFYQSYRAVVRAKINLFQLQQCQIPAACQILEQSYNQSMALAESYITMPSPQLIITHGISGSGKTTRAARLAAQLNAIHLRSDVERKRLFTKTDYRPEAIDKVYQHLAQLAETLLTHGYTVIVDATFLYQAQRAYFHSIAQRHQAPFFIIACEVDAQTCQTRLQQRAQMQQDYSDAGFQVAQQQRQQIEPLTAAELQFVKEDI